MTNNGASLSVSPEVDGAEIWLVEDNVVFRKAVVTLIDETAGLNCTRCFDGCEPSLEALQSGELPDLILMDIGMPGMDGITGVGRVKSIAPALPVVMLTVHQDNDKIFQAICNGASGYMLKSCPKDELIAGLRTVLGGGAAMDGQIARRVLEMFMRMSVPQTTYGLSDREKEILQHLIEGQSKKEIAADLFLSPHTIDSHLRNIYAKLHVHNRSGAIAKALKEKII